MQGYRHMHRGQHLPSALLQYEVVQQLAAASGSQLDVGTHAWRLLAAMKLAYLHVQGTAPQ